MISHEHKCIFIHIPSTAGSVIEQSIVGKDWQQIEPRTKHLNATLSKIYYKKYWKDYFKFTFVRNPFDWVVSMYSKSRPADLKGMLFEEFLELIDRFKTLNWECPLNRIDIPLIKNCKELDFVGTFENLTEDFKYIAKKLNINSKLSKVRLHSNKRDKDYKKYYNNKTIRYVKQIFKMDFIKLGYEL